MPADMRAVFITLSDAFRSMRQDGGGNLLDTLIETLEADAESPPKEVKGVSDAFLDGAYQSTHLIESIDSRGQAGQIPCAFHSPEVDCLGSEGLTVRIYHQNSTAFPRNPSRKQTPAPSAATHSLTVRHPLSSIVALRSDPPPSPHNISDRPHRPVPPRRPAALPQRPHLRPRMHRPVAETARHLSDGPEEPAEEERTAAATTRGRGRGWRVRRDVRMSFFFFKLPVHQLGSLSLKKSKSP